MFSTVLGMPRPSEKLKSHEKVDFGDLLKHCNLNCFGHFLTLSGRHNFVENLFSTLSDGKLKNVQRNVKHMILVFCATDFLPKRYRFEVRKGPFLRSINK